MKEAIDRSLAVEQLNEAQLVSISDVSSPQCGDLDGHY
jgi:hypothetical protein